MVFKICEGPLNSLHNFNTVGITTIHYCYNLICYWWSEICCCHQESEARSQTCVSDWPDLWIILTCSGSMEVFFSSGRGSPEPILIRMGLLMGTSAWSFSADHLLFYRDREFSTFNDTFRTECLALYKRQFSCGLQFMTYSRQTCILLQCIIADVS